MNGATIVGELLRASAALTVVVPAERIKGGRLPEGSDLPAVLVRTASSVERQTLKRGATTRTVDRVAVTVRAASWREQTAIIALLKTVCAGRVGEVAGAKAVAIITAGTGPDLDGPGGSFEQTQDFRVSFDA